MINVGAVLKAAQKGARTTAGKKFIRGVENRAVNRLLLGTIHQAERTAKDKTILGFGAAGSAIGGYRGAKADWNKLSEEEKKGYLDAYGSEANARRVFRNKNITTGVVSGFMDGASAGGAVKMTGRVTVRSFKFFRKYDPRSLQSKAGRKLYVRWLFGKPAKKVEAKAEPKIKTMVKDFALPMLRDTALIYGASNIYGEAVKKRDRVSNPDRRSGSRITPIERKSSQRDTRPW